MTQRKRQILQLATDWGIDVMPRKISSSTKTVNQRSSVNQKDGKILKPEERQQALDQVNSKLKDCVRCKLSAERKNVVFGVGNPAAKIMFVGEAPGRDEDLQGIPFVGRAGQLLTKIIEAMGLKRDDVYIANIAKCRPPNNRAPEPDEVATCIPFLIEQAKIITPQVIVCLGSVATKNLLSTELAITGLRGKWTSWENIPVMPTYHPAFLLRNPAKKKEVWEDMQKVMEKLGLTPPEKQP